MLVQICINVAATYNAVVEKLWILMRSRQQCNSLTISDDLDKIQTAYMATNSIQTRTAYMATNSNAGAVSSNAIKALTDSKPALLTLAQKMPPFSYFNGRDQHAKSAATIRENATDQACHGREGQYQCYTIALLIKNKEPYMRQRREGLAKRGREQSTCSDQEAQRKKVTALEVAPQQPKTAYSPRGRHRCHLLRL